MFIDFNALTKGAFICIVLILHAFAAPAQETQPQHLTLSKAIEMSLSTYVDIKIADEAIREAQHMKKSARGSFGPIFRLEASVLRWDGPSKVSFIESDGEQQQVNLQIIDPAQFSDPQLQAVAGHVAGLETILGQMLQQFSLPMTVRDAWTTTTTVSIVQPITPLYSIYQAHELASLDIDIAQIQREKAKQEITYNVTKAYYQLLLAMRFEDIASTAVEQTSTHEKKAQRFHEAGLVAKNDLLKAQIAVASAKEALIKAQTAVSMARTVFNQLVGIANNDHVDLDDPYGQPLPKEELSIDAYQKKASDQRLELTVLKRRIEQADKGTNIAWARMIPTISAIGSYEHTTGSKFQEEDVFYVGGVLSWDFWEWGHSWYQIDAAQSKAEQARLGLTKVRDLIRLDVRKNYLELRSTEQSLAVAEAKITQAEENLRIEEKHYEANNATSTDVLDAQLLLVRSKNTHATMYYNYLIALAGLKKATGEL